MSKLVFGTNYNDGTVVLNKGTFYVEKKKYGLTVDGYIGDLSNSNILQRPSYVGTPDFSAVKGFYTSYQFYEKFADQQQITGVAKFGVVRLPYERVMMGCFKGSYITGLEMNNLISVSGSYALAQLCKSCPSIAYASFNSLYEVSGDRSFMQAFQACGTYLTHIDFPNLHIISGSNSFVQFASNDNGLTTLNFPTLEVVSGYRACYSIAFGCTRLLTVSMPNLQRVSGGSAFMDGFYGCTSNTFVDISNLEEITGDQAFGEAFSENTSLTTVDFYSLRRIRANLAFQVAFNGDSNLTDVSFYSLQEIVGISNFESAWEDCTSLEYLRFNNLELLSGGIYNTGNFYQALKGCTNLKILRFDMLCDFSGDGNPLGFLYQMIPWIDGQTTPSPTDIYFLNFSTGNPLVAAWGTGVLGQMLGTGRTRGCRIHLPEVSRDGLLAAQGSEDDIMAGLGANRVVGDSLVWAKNKITNENNVNYALAPGMGEVDKFAWYKQIGEGPDYIYTPTDVPQIGDTYYSDSVCTIPAGTITGVYPE